ncbi:hypothetical protein FKM82_027716 [Ascaphus truei]
MAWLCLLMVLLGSCSLSSSSHVHDFKPPRYNISLDLPPKLRWEPVLKHYNSTYLREVFTYITNIIVPKWVHAVIRPLAELDLEHLVHEPYAGEIRGISRALGMSAGDILLINFWNGKWWENAISAFLKRSSPVSWLMRDALNDAKDFQSATLQLSRTPIIAEVYYIMAGTMPREGVIISRDRSGPADIWPLDPIHGEWFHVETNYDHWTTPPPHDDRRCGLPV